MGIVSNYQYLVPHRASALMFQALSQIQGIRVIDHATTLAGRKGIAVAADDPSRGTPAQEGMTRQIGECR